MRWKIKPISKSISDLENKFSPTLMSTDANNAITSGLYYLTGDCANRPADWCTMTVVAYDNDTLSQTATSVITGKTYVRAKSVNGWTSWEELALNSNFDSLNAFKSITSFTANDIDGFAYLLTQKMATLPDNSFAPIIFVANFTNGIFTPGTHTVSMFKLNSQYFWGIGTIGSNLVKIHYSNGTWIFKKYAPTE